MDAIFSIVSNNYLHFARTLFQSVREHHPDSKCYCVIVDRDNAPAAVLSHEFEVIHLDQLGLPGGDQFLFQYTILELNTAVKPWAIQYLLDLGIETVTYIDPDILIYRPLDEVRHLFDVGSDIVVTPHLLAPMLDRKTPSELDIRRAGTYNFGFCSVRTSENTRSFLKWWQGKLVRDCVVDMERGIFVDQSWIDLVPGLFQGVAILRHQGYNVAYWNIAQRPLRKGTDDRWQAAGESLVFFHFSGFNPFNPEPFSKHQNRFTVSNLGQAGELVLDYAARTIANGAKNYSKLPYGFAWFSDRSPVPDVFRRIYRENEAIRIKMGGNPFDHPEILLQRGEPSLLNGTSPTYAMLSLWHARRDLQQAFHLGNDESIAAFHHWFVLEGAAYFSEAIIRHHKHALPQSNLPGSGQPLTPASISRSRVHSLFLDLLKRVPDIGAVEHYSPICTTRLGYLRAWRDIGLSRESRQRRRLIRRMLKALFVPHKFRGPFPVRTYPAAGFETSNRPAFYSGLFPGEAGAIVEGIWAGTQVCVPISAKAGDHIVLAGSYYADLIKRQTGDVKSTLSFLYGGNVVSETDLQVDGDFTVDFPLPVGTATGSKELYIRCDKAFVPKDIGVNDDGRSLAWRLKKLAIGPVAVVDCARETALLAPEEYLPPPGVNLIGYLAAESGVGEAARSFAKAANSTGIPYFAVDVGYQNPNLQRDGLALIGAVDTRFDIDVVYVNADQTPQTLEFLKSKNHRSRAAIGFWHWEQPELPKRFMGSFEGLIEVWTPSGFVQDAVAKVSPVPVFKVPHAIEFSISPNTNRTAAGLPETGFLALVMYDFHSYHYRKNPEAAISAFRLAAANREDAWLVIKTINADKHPDKYSQLKDSLADLKNVILIDKFLTRQEVYDLEANCDCLISLHRAEGFGLGPAEMMYLGKPVIATGWSANMEFMTPMNSFPIEYELKTLNAPIGPYEAGQVWAEASVEHAAACLKSLIKGSDLAATVGRRAASSIRSQLSPEAVGRQYRARIALLARRLGLS